MNDKLNVKEIAARYNIPLQYSKYPRRITPEPFPKISPKNLTKMVQYTFDESFNYTSKIFSKLEPAKHYNFIKSLDKALPKIPKFQLKYPINIKHTETTRIKQREKYEIPKKMAYQKPFIKTWKPAAVSRMSLSSTENGFNSTSHIKNFKIIITQEEQVEDDKSKPISQLDSICNNSMLNRTRKEQKTLFQILKGFPISKKYRNEVMERLCIVGCLYKYKCGQIVAQPNTLAENLFILLKGTIDKRKFYEETIKQRRMSSLVPCSMVKRNSVSIDQYVPGSIFGLETSGETKIIVALNDVIVLKVDSEEYNRILRDMNEKSQKRRIALLNTISITRNMETDLKACLAKLITIIKYTDKQLIDEQYSKITTMRIIFKGSVQLFLILQDNSRINLAVLEQGDYFGEQIYFNKHLYSYFSVEAIGDVQIGFVPAPEFHSLTGSRVVMQNFTIKSQDQYELDLQLLNREQNKTWSVLRTQQMTKLLKEWKNEPNIDYKRWIHENNKVL